MDVKILEITDLLKQLADALANGSPAEEQLSEEDTGKLAGKFKDLGTHMEATRDRLNRAIEWAKSNEDRRAILYLAQVHSHINTVLHSATQSQEILEHFAHTLKHDRECECVKSEAATEAPKAPEVPLEPDPGSSASVASAE